MIKWVARFAFVTVLLGLAGTFLILKDINQNPVQRKVKKADEDSLSKTKTIQPPIPLSTGPQNSFKTIGQIKPKADLVSRISDKAHIENPELQREKGFSTGKNIYDEKVKFENKTTAKKPATPLQRKLLTDSELQQLVNRVNAAKEKHNIYSNCVQIYSSELSMNEQAIAQVEAYLRSQPFAIAGRETISKRVKGIQVSPAGECIRITIGDF